MNDDLLHRFLRATYRLHRLIKIEAPPAIIDKEKEIIKNYHLKLLSIGINSTTYLESVNGQIEYLITCADEDQLNNISIRCGQCTHYCLFNTYICEIYKENRPVICEKFDDSNMDITQRLAQLACGRCCSCEYVTQINNEICSEFNCSKKLSLIAIQCNQFKGPK